MDTVAMLEQSKLKYSINYSLRGASTFRVGGTCALAIFPESAEQIALAAYICRESGMRFSVVGRGSNILFSDGQIDRAIIFTHGAVSVRAEGDLLYAEAGVSLPRLCLYAAERGMGGLEFASGIPGSVGGALFMNAGAYGESVSDTVVSSTALDLESGERVSISEHSFGYRQSIYMQSNSLVCLEAVFKTRSCEPESIRQRISELAKKRRESQPLEYPSAGSYFKRPEGHFAGKLIEDCGLKGASCGGARVSEKHAGFIINTGAASCADILALEELVRTTVRQKTGVVLEREVELIE